MTYDRIGMVEAKCPVCGIAGYFAAGLTPEGMLARTDWGPVDPQSASQCKDAEALQLLEASGQLNCPNLDRALVRAVEAAGLQNKGQGDPQ